MDIITYALSKKGIIRIGEKEYKPELENGNIVYKEIKKPVKYTTFRIGQSKARSAGTMKLVNISPGSIEELYINNVAQELPTGVTDDKTDDRPAVITNYEVNPGDVVRIKGGFSLWETELPINNVVLQNDLKSYRMMFYGCTGLTETPIIPEGVENCSFMFDGCTGLTQAPVIPSSVRDCSMMFAYCSSLTEAPTIPSSVTNCSGMFAGTGLTEAPTIPSSVTNCMGMFLECTNLAAAPVIPSSVTDCSYMFMECTNLAAAPVIPSSVTDCTMMFQGCTNLTVIPEENMNLINNPREGLIFEGCYNECPLVADSIPKNWGGNKVEEVPGEYTTFTAGESGTLKLGNMYKTGIEELYIDNVVQELPTGRPTSGGIGEYAVENGQKIKIKGCFSLYGNTLLIKDIVLQKDLGYYGYMFYGCTSLTEAPVIPTSAYDCGSMFEGCTGLAKAPVIPSSVTSCSSMFKNCSNLTEAPVIPSSVTNCSSMFYGCNTLADAPIIPTTVTDCSSMFYGCNGFTYLPQENVDLMNNPPTGLSYSQCYRNCTRIGYPIRYDQIPSGWK